MWEKGRKENERGELQVKCIKMEREGGYILVRERTEERERESRYYRS